MKTEELKKEAEEVAKSSEPPPAVEDLAAHDYKMALPDFFEQLDKFSGSKLKRVFGAIVEYPFEVQQVTFSYPEEKELFELAMKIFDCKFVMMKAALAMKQTEIEELFKQLEEQKKQEEASKDVV